ncbi:unnamed protein product, partial [Polarella glacialis]
DGFVVEYLKYGWEIIRNRIIEMVQHMWQCTILAEEGHEADAWPAEWKIGLVVPLWKKKGDRQDKNTWRGVTLLSVGTKLLARVVASRLARWSDQWLHEGQTGFRAGRGTDDAQQVSRRIAEEVSKVDGDEVVLLRFFDIEKAYPRVCKDGMWEVLKRRGCPAGMVKLARAIHEHTAMKVRMHGGCSETYVPDRGLREGCPSSPVLFNIYHDAVMQDFRDRRLKSAAERGETPGLSWAYKVDGRLSKRQTDRAQQHRHVRTVLLGDFGYADDTAIVGMAGEALKAEQLFANTLADWEEKVHPGKTEGVRISGVGNRPTDVRYHGEAAGVRHVGGWVADNGRATIETKKRAAAVRAKLVATAETWTFGGHKAKERAFAGQAQWLEKCLRAADIPSGDWFRLAQTRSAWRNMVSAAFPTSTLTEEQKKDLDKWRPGRPLPNNTLQDETTEQPDEPVGPDNENSGDEGPATATFPCWVCEDVFQTGNSRKFHYETTHAICNPELVTIQCFTCQQCFQHYPRVEMRERHECPMQMPLARLSLVDKGGDPGEARGETMAVPQERHMYTDGSGGDGSGVAGWGAVAYQTMPKRPTTPDYVLYGPVVTQPWDPVFLGEVVPAWIHYDSEYACDLATRRSTPTSNMELAERIAQLVEQVRARRPLRFKHVKGHSNDVGNDAADKYADWGSQGRATAQWHRWSTAPPAWERFQGLR